MRLALICIAATLLALTGGCVFDKYVIVMTPQGDAVRRTLTCWRENTQENGKPPTLETLPKEELDRIGKLYAEKPVEDGPAKRTFAGNFKGALPSDVGGAGTYTRLMTEMGDLFFYSERFRGDDDQAQVVADMSYAADQFTDLLILWFESEMKQDPLLTKLRGFMDANLRQDIKNVALDMWMSGPTGKLEPGLARAAQYLVERGYVKPEDAPRLAALWHGNDQRRNVELLRRLVADRMGVPPEAPLPASLGFLSGPESVSASWDKFLTESAAYKTWFADLDMKRLRPKADANNPEKEKPDPKDPVGVLAPSLVVMEFPMLSDSTHVDVTLNCKAAPIYTNGVYDAAKGSVTWSEALRDPPVLPALCTVVWAIPNENFQKAHFGRTVLTGEELSGYVLWRRLLLHADAKEWTLFLDSLQPGATLIEKVKAFRFSSDPKTENAPSLADEPRTAILKALEGGNGETNRKEH